MQGTDLWNWVWWILGGASGVAAIGLSAWALAWDRSRGRPRCPRCWYSMEGAVSTRCPECGHSASHAGAWYRTRRRWTLGFAGLLGLVAASQVFQQPWRLREGWTRWIPSTALVCAMTPTDPFKPTKVVNVLRSRDDDLWDWQVAIVHQRDARVTGDDLRASLKTRDVWPVGVPITVALRTGAWSVPNIGYTIVTARETHGVGVELSRAERQPSITSCFFSGRPPDSLEIPPRPAGTLSLEFDVAMTAGGVCLQRERVPLEIKVGGSIRDHLRAVADPALTGLIRSQLGVGFVGEEHILVAELAWDTRFRADEWKDTYIQPRFDLLYRGKVEGVAQWRGGNWSDLYAYFHPAPGAEHVITRRQQEFDAPTDDTITSLRGDPADWTLRVRGDPDTAAREIDTTAFWDGAFDLPLAEVPPPRL